MIAGINYPWTIVNGRPNYGCDFGRNIWNSHTGVSTHVDDVQADLHAMAGLGIEVVRWFVFTDGRGGIRWGADRRCDGLDTLFFTDMDAALTCARDAGVRLCLVLFDYAWMHDPMRRAMAASARDRAGMIGALVEPLLDAYGTAGARADLGQAIHSFDIINEPDWVTAGLEPPFGRETLTLDELRAFVGDVSASIHARSSALVTLGGGRVRFATEWDHPAYGLDFIQVHSYPDVRYQDRDLSVFGRSAASFGLSKPLLIGEHAASPRQHPPDHLPPAYWPEDYQALARDGGYLGAWPWSFKGVDAFGTVGRAGPARSSGPDGDR
ncbi:MAG: hypothetical protein Q8T13_00910 [Acidobacteriota bacterium]|nr:hypothetical protein [Acidobacteriota bacterium]